MKVVCKTNQLTTDNNFEVLVLIKPDGAKDIYDDDWSAPDFWSNFKVSL